MEKYDMITVLHGYITQEDDVIFYVPVGEDEKTTIEDFFRKIRTVGYYLTGYEHSSGRYILERLH